MISCRYVISTNHGLHAANAMSLSRAASDYQCKITLESAKGVADCKNVLSLMSLGAKQGESLILWQLWVALLIELEAQIL